MGPNPPLGSGPLSFIVKCHLLIFVGFNTVECNPTSPGRVIPNSHIPNIRPQIDLNLFMSIFNILGKTS